MKKKTTIVLSCLLIAYMALSIALQAVAGNIDAGTFAFPVSLALGVSVIGFLFVLNREFEGKEWERQLRSRGAACVILVLATVCCIIGGSMPSSASFHASWWFLAVLLLLEAQLTLVLIHRLRKFRLGCGGSFFLVHTGLWLALFSAIVGEGDTSDVRALIRVGETVSTGICADGKVRPLGYSLQLLDLRADTDASGMPVQYEAVIALDSVPMRLAVNAPVSVGIAEDIYISGYLPAGKEDGRKSASCVLQVVRQPWKYPMLAGLIMLMAGMVWYVFTVKSKGRVMPC
ncbi:MAG: cytochrome c biogenesis protein ResB [Prevotella sp.]